MQLASRLVRSVLFVPGDRPDRFDRARDSGADLICLDLEDGVRTENKAAARAAAAMALGEKSHAQLAVRINPLQTRAGMLDLLAISAADAKPDFVLLPKVRAFAEIEIAAGVVANEDIAFIALIECVAGLAQVQQIAAADRCAAILFGGADYAAAIGSGLNWDALLMARSAIVAACAHARIPAIDVPSLHLDDEASIEEEARRVRAIGMSGKAAIHPRQIPAIHRAFTPTPAEVEHALAALDAFDAGGRGAIRFSGELIDEPVAANYARIVAAATCP